MTRSRRRCLAWFGILGIAFAQIAVTAHACALRVGDGAVAPGVGDATAHEGHCGGQHAVALPQAPQGNACEVQCTDGAPSGAAPDLPPVALVTLRCRWCPHDARSKHASGTARCWPPTAPHRRRPAVLPSPDLDLRVPLVPGRAALCVAGPIHAFAEVACCISGRRPGPTTGQLNTGTCCRGCTLAVAALAVIAASPAAAAEPPLSLAETLKIAVARSQQLVSQRAMVDAAREMAIPAGELPDPKLKAGVENVPTQGDGRVVADARLHDHVEDRPDAGIPERGQAPAEGRSASSATPSAAPR